MSKNKTDITEQKNRIEAILEKLDKRDEDYNPTPTEFEIAMNTENNSKVINGFLSVGQFVKEVQLALGELKQSKKAQETYVLYALGRLVTVIHDWTFFDLIESGFQLVDKTNQKVENFQETLNYHLSNKPKNKKAGIFHYEPKSELYDLVELYLENKNSHFVMTKQNMTSWNNAATTIKTKIEGIKKKLEIREEYRNTMFYNNVYQYMDVLDKNYPASYEEMMLIHFIYKPSKNEMTLLNNFWGIVEKLDNAAIFPKLKEKLKPENIVDNFLNEKIHINEEEVKNKHDKHSIFQKLMIVKALKIDEFLLHDTQLTQAQLCKTLGALAGCNYKVFENYFGQYAQRLKEDGTQINKDKDAIEEFFTKAKMADVVNLDTFM